MDLSNIELDTELVHKLSLIPEGAEDVDYEALGIDVNSLRAQLQSMIETQVKGQIQDQMDFFNKVELFLHPFFLCYFLIIILTTFFAIRAKSNVPSILYILGGFMAIVFSEFLNEIVRDTIGEWKIVFENNPFDADGLFFTLSFLQPILYAMIILSIRFLLGFLHRLCCKGSTGNMKKEKVTTDVPNKIDQKKKKE